MNIFLDTTVFYDDPFLKKPFNKQLLFLSEKNSEFKVYISKVVLAEAERHYKVKLKEELKRINEAELFLKTLPIDNAITISTLSAEKYANKFMEYYNDLDKCEIINIVNYNNDMLPELVRRSVNRVKPFTDKKEEFRDAIIWLSYAALAEQEDLTKCYLITNNVSDYAKNGDLHPDMKQDSERFKLIKNTFGLFQLPELMPYTTNYELSLWVNNQTYTTNDMFSILAQSSDCHHSLFDSLTRYIDYGRTGIDVIDYTEGKLLEMDLIQLKSWEFEVYADNIFLEATVEVSSEIQLFSSVVEVEMQELGILDSYSWNLHLYATFDKNNGLLADFEVTDIEVTEF